MSINLIITSPKNNIGFVEYKRSFVVEGDIYSSCELKDNLLLSIDLLDSYGHVVRHVQCDKKNKDIFASYPDLVTYSDDEDPGREQFQKYGFPLLVVNDVNNPYDSLNLGYIKAWYDDHRFKAIIPNANSVSTGSIFESDFELVDENNNLYNCLSIGKYKLMIKLFDENELISFVSKDIEIGKRKEQFICRFNPLSHKERMLDWCKINNIPVIDEPLPGYLDSYLGHWEYHKGLLKTYRANDICLFDDVDVVFFDYLIDKHSTSYETELAYLQSKNKLKEKKFDVYYYEIGEAIFGDGKSYKKESEIIKFSDNEFGSFCRVDILNSKIVENQLYLDERYIQDSLYDLSDICIKGGTYFSIMGIIKPFQLDPNDFVLKEDNTYEVLNYPKYIDYQFYFNGKTIHVKRDVGLERFIDNKSIGTSVYEFYNYFIFNEEIAGNDIMVKANVIYEKGDVRCISNAINIRVE